MAGGSVIRSLPSVIRLQGATGSPGNSSIQHKGSWQWRRESGSGSGSDYGPSDSESETCEDGAHAGFHALFAPYVRPDGCREPTYNDDDDYAGDEEAHSEPAEPDAAAAAVLGVGPAVSSVSNGHASSLFID